jgi:hypothetical protein
MELATGAAAAVRGETKSPTRTVTALRDGPESRHNTTQRTEPLIWQARALQQVGKTLEFHWGKRISYVLLPRQRNCAIEEPKLSQRHQGRTSGCPLPDEVASHFHLQEPAAPHPKGRITASRRRR